MLKTQAIKEFGSGYKIAKELGIAQSTISRWGEIVPAQYAIALEALRPGRLKFNKEFYRWNAKVK